MLLVGDFIAEVEEIYIDSSLYEYIFENLVK